MSFRDPARPVVRAALCSLVLVAVACSDDVEVGGFGGGGGSPSSGPGGEAGAGPTTSSTTTTGSEGSGTTVVSSSNSGAGTGGEGQGGEAGASSTGQGGEGGAGQGGSEPTVCGGLAEDGSPTCDDDTWCDYPDESFCGGDDSTGLCLPRPLHCSDSGPVVCGCDGEAYTNVCYANLAGTDLSTDDQECGAPCEAGVPCAADEFCQYADDNCGFTDLQPGVCVKRPAAASCATFPDPFVPICACDGQIYENGCEAAAAGSDVWGGEDLCKP